MKDNPSILQDLMNKLDEINRVISNCGSASEDMKGEVEELRVRDVMRASSYPFSMK